MRESTGIGGQARIDHTSGSPADPAGEVPRTGHKESVAHCDADDLPEEASDDENAEDALDRADRLSLRAEGLRRLAAQLRRNAAAIDSEAAHAEKAANELRARARRSTG